MITRPELLTPLSSLTCISESHIIKPYGWKEGSQSFLTNPFSSFCVYHTRMLRWTFVCSFMYAIFIQQVFIKHLLCVRIWRRAWQPTPVFLPGEFHGQRSLVSYSPQGCKESDTTEQLILTHTWMNERPTYFVLKEWWVHYIYHFQIQVLVPSQNGWFLSFACLYSIK